MIRAGKYVTVIDLSCSGTVMTRVVKAAEPRSTGLRAPIGVGAYRSINKSNRGLVWIPGSHTEDSPQARALLVAFKLTEGE